MKHKKWMALGLAALLSTGAIAGCSTEKSSQETTSQEQKTDATKGDESDKEKSHEGTELTFWMQPYGTDPANQTAAMDKVTSDFFEKTGIKVNYTINDWSSANQKLTLACTGGEAPDVADIFFTNSFVEMSTDEYGLLEINDVIEELGGESSWYSAGKDEACVNGKWYGVPWRFDTRVLIYNTEDFEKAGITEAPETWDELVETAKKLTTTDENGNITHAGLAWYSDMGRYDQSWFSMLAQCGGQLMNDDFSEFTFNSDQGKKSLQFLSDCINKYNICNSSVDASYDALTEFMGGNVSMVFGGAADNRTSILNAAPQMENKFAAAPMPVAGDAENENHAIAFSAPVAVFKTTQNPEAAKEWVKYFCSEEVQLYLSKQLSLLNSNINVMKDPYFTEDAWLNAFVETSKNSQAGDMPLTTWSQLDAWPDGPIPKMCSEVVNGTDIDSAIEKCMQGLKTIGY